VVQCRVDDCWVTLELIMRLRGLAFRDRLCRCTPPRPSAVAFETGKLADDHSNKWRVQCIADGADRVTAR
jgi:hypothetical protein